MYSRFCGYLQFNIFNTELKGKKCQDVSLLDNCRWEESLLLLHFFDRWKSRCYSLPLFSCQSFEFQPKLEFFSELSGVLFLFFLNRSCACLRQMNKFNHQTSFWNCKAAKFCVLKWVPESVQLIRIPAHKERKYEEFYLQARRKGDIFPFDLNHAEGPFICHI